LHKTSEDEDFLQVPVTVTSGRLGFVPKTSKESRTILVEPILNGFYQKGLGTAMRQRLQRGGLDLSNQDTNRRLAWVGSMDGSLATLDLSSASDTVSSGLVWNLLPYDWALALSYGRSEVAQVKTRHGTVDLRLHKFSSMGNAYTFELESLIFYALTVSTCEHLGIETLNRVSVYGDDIIVPVEAYVQLCDVLTYCGFVVNPAKSFAAGPFRESCGADLLGGFDIRPFYQKELVSERSLYTMHNWFVRHCEPDLAAYVLSHCQPDALRGPDGFGDGHLVTTHELRRNRAANRRQWEGGYFDTYSLRSRQRKDVLPGDAVLPVYSIYVSDGETLQDHNTIRGNAGYQKLSIYTLATSVFRRN